MTRIVAAIVMALAVLGVVWWLPAWGLSIFILLAAGVGLAEFTRMFLADRVERWTAFGAGLVAAGCMIFSRDDAEAVVLVLAGLLFVVALLFMRRAQALEGIADRLGLAVMGVLYLGVAFPVWSWLASLPAGRSIVLLALVPACLCDTFGLATGKAFGRHKLAPLVSPKKTQEGLAGALVGSIIGVFLMRLILLPQLPFADAAALAVVIWIASPMGDLIESMIKRSAGVKDSGTIIPGHGGLLDRLDALTFAGPFAYVYVKYILQF